MAAACSLVLAVLCVMHPQALLSRCLAGTRPLAAAVLCCSCARGSLKNCAQRASQVEAAQKLLLMFILCAACLHLTALIAGLVIPASCHVTVGRCVRTASNTACAAMAAALAAAAAISIEFDVAEVLVVSTDRLGSSGNCSVLSVHPLGRDGSSP